MINWIGTAIIVVIWAWALQQTLLSVPMLGLGAAGVGLLIVTVVAGVSLAIIWNWNLATEGQ